MNKRTWLFFFCLFFLFVSCDILRDSPYEVEAWTPGEGFHADPGKLKISLLLSHESDRAKTEQAFSLTEDRKTLKGNFIWEGSKLIFLPASPLKADRDYVISLGTGAQDTRGVSLEQKFEVSFTTWPPGGKPRIGGTEPGHEGIMPESRGEFRIRFSEPVRINSCLDYISFSPSAPGSWRLEDDNRTACFIPREAWQAGEIYRVKVDGAFSSVSGSVLGTDFSSVFSAGEDREKPVLLKVFASGGGGEDEEIPLEKPGAPPGTEYGAWENSTRLSLVFSEPVDLREMKNLLSCDPNAALVMESPPEMASRAVFRFAENQAWGTSFIFRLASGVSDRAGNKSDGDYIFRIKTSGRLSMPPELAGIRLPMAPGNAADMKVLSFSRDDVLAGLPIKAGEGRYPHGEKIISWIELYFKTAPDTEIDPFSVMDLFRVETTNNPLVFSPRGIRTENFTMAEPKDGWENFSRVEIGGILINTVHTGTVTFCILPGLRDKRGNRSVVNFRISLQK